MTIILIMTAVAAVLIALIFRAALIVVRGIVPDETDEDMTTWT